ncbi:MAG TPA: serine hydrolase domain-containing protein [Candidatus Saccharimonadia bacterium]|nr:serine hydrolase domain-containing protein [Candidatus Saccharimonadia bacterium]
MTQLLAWLLLLAPAFAAAAPALPDTAAGRVLAEWIAAYNSGDRSRVAAFVAAHAFPHDADEMLAWREGADGSDLVAIERSEPLAIEAWLQEQDSDTIQRLVLQVDASVPPKVVDFSFANAKRPPRLALPRLTRDRALASLRARLDELARRDRFSGVVLVAHEGRVLLHEARGLANREAKVPVTVDTRFRIGSMNKMFTGVAVLQLVEAGKLSLDRTVGDYLADYPNRDVARYVTVRHLLTHTGGTGDIFGPQFDARRAQLRTHDDYVKLYGARGLEHAPGKEDRYSNYGMVLLGALIEHASGESYYDYVQSNVFERAGMASTGSLPESDPVPRRATGYMRAGEAWVDNRATLPYRGTAAGGGYSTAADLLRFAQALEAGTLVSKAMLARATSPQNVQQWYGYGFVVLDQEGIRSHGHSGGAPGMNAELRIYPKLGYVLVALSNLDPPASQRVLDHFALRMPIAP